MGRRNRVEGEQNHNIYVSERADGTRPLELGYKDSLGKQRWKTLGEVGIKAARAERDEILGKRGKGEKVVPSPRLRFGDAAERWLAEQVAELRPNTRAVYSSDVRLHLWPRWGRRRLDLIGVGDVTRLVRELREAGKEETTISGVLKAAGRIFKFAQRHMGWLGQNPIGRLERGERPRTGGRRRRRIYQGEELEQTLAAAHEPWRTLFALAAVTGARESELLALWWEDFDLADPDDATVTISVQVDRKGIRQEPKTEDSGGRVIELPRQLVAMLLAHKARSRFKGTREFVFCSRSGRPLGQRNVLRALRLAQTKAVRPDGLPTFPSLHERDERGRPVAATRGSVPIFHSFRHSAASQAIAAGESAEEISWQLGHKDSTVTRAVYVHEIKSQERRARRRARMEAQYGSVLEAADGSRAQQTGPGASGHVVDLQEIRHRAQ